MLKIARRRDAVEADEISETAGGKESNANVSLLRCAECGLKG